MNKFIQSSYFKPFTALLSAILLMFTVLPILSKASSLDGISTYPSKTLPELESTFEIVEMIEESDTKVVYKVLENGKYYIYEELINGDEIITEKYLFGDSTQAVLEKFSTVTTINENEITVKQTDILNGNLISNESVEIQSSEESGIFDDAIYSPNATGVWVKTSAAGNQYSYYKYSNGGGKARELYKEKTFSSYNQKFDQFTRNVDALRGYEQGALRDLLLIGVLDQALKTIKNPTYSNVKEFLKKYLKTLPGVGLVISLVNYMHLCNKTMFSYKALAGTEKDWR